jgi:hypothetical protein
MIRGSHKGATPDANSRPDRGTSGHEVYVHPTAILEAGGIPVLAHPGLLEYESDQQLDELIGLVKQMGIQGIEVYYPEHTADQTVLFKELAQRHDLLMTGGTDFHGGIHPEIEMGSGKGNLHISYELYQKLIQHKKRTSNVEVE